MISLLWFCKMGLVKFIDHRWINVFSLESSMLLPGSRQYTPNNNFSGRRRVSWPPYAWECSINMWLIKMRKHWFRISLGLVCVGYSCEFMKLKALCLDVSLEFRVLHQTSVHAFLVAFKCLLHKQNEGIPLNILIGDINVPFWMDQSNDPSQSSLTQEVTTLCGHIKTHQQFLS